MIENRVIDPDAFIYFTILNQGNDPNSEFALASMEKAIESSSMAFKNEDMVIFLELMNQFLVRGGNPNLIFPRISIGENEFHHVSCFHVVYLYWKDPGMQWNRETDEHFEKTIDSMLSDPRTDLSLTFTEETLFESSHFIDHKIQSEEEGYFLERITIAHYASALQDLEMLDKLLRKEPSLIETKCCHVKAKNVLHENILSVVNLSNNILLQGQKFIEEYDEDTGAEFVESLTKIKNLDHDDEISGDLAWGCIDPRGPYYDVTRVVNVTLLHLAARLGDPVLCGYLRGKNANLIALDSDGRTPLDYLELSLSEGVVEQNKTIANLRKSLKPIVQLRMPYLPQTSIILKKEGFWIIYDTRNKIASYTYEKLTKDSLRRNTNRNGINFKVDWEVPKQNRTKSNDYAHSGYQKGHLVPAANAVSSDRAMEDTFLLTNITPQTPKFNLGYWKKLETHIRTLVNDYDLIEVFTGSLFVPQTFTDGKNRVYYEVIGSGVAVPTHFFKVLYLHKRTPECRAYILPNADIPFHTDLSSFSATVDRIQELSGILFNQWRA
jgi:endonuclease G